MSIIYEALKKADKGFAGACPPEKRKKKSRFKRISFFVLPAFVFAASFYAAYNFSGLKGRFFGASGRKVPLGRKEAPPGKILSSGKGESSRLPAGNSSRRSPSRLMPAYVLEGIVFDQNESFAVINGKSLKKGDKINSFRVTEIAPDSVKLTDSQEEKEITLSLSFF